MRWLIICILTFSLLHCGKSRKKASTSPSAANTVKAPVNTPAASSPWTSKGLETAPGVTENGEAQKLRLSWDGKKSKGKVALTVVAKGKRGFEQRVSLGSYTYNSAYDEGFVPDGCNKCKDSYTSCKKMKGGYNPDLQWKKDKRIKGELCARLGRSCVESCEMGHVLSVTFDDGVVTVQDYTNCFGYRKMTCPEKPKVVKKIRIAPKGSTLGKAKKKSRKKVDCYRKHCGRCSNSKFTRCMNKQGHPGFHDCGCG